MNYYELIEGRNFIDNVVGQRGRSLDRTIYNSDAWTDYINQIRNDPDHPFIENEPKILPEPDYTLYDPDLDKFENKPILYLLNDSVFVVNDTFKHFLSKQNLSPHIINNQTIKHRSDTYNYWIFHFYHHNFNLIDFSKSIFYKSDSYVNSPSYDDRDFYRYKNLDEFKLDIHSSKVYSARGNYSHFIFPQKIKLIDKMPYSMFSLGYFISREINGIIINQYMYDLLSSMDLHGISLVTSKIIS